MIERRNIIGKYQFEDGIHIQYLESVTPEDGGKPLSINGSFRYKGGDPYIDKLPLQPYENWQRYLDSQISSRGIHGFPWKRADGSIDVTLAMMYCPPDMDPWS